MRFAQGLLKLLFVCSSRKFNKGENNGHRTVKNRGVCHAYWNGYGISVPANYDWHDVCKFGGIKIYK